jgi:hypothetical protein
MADVIETALNISLYYPFRTRDTPKETELALWILQPLGFSSSFSAVWAGLGVSSAGVDGSGVSDGLQPIKVKVISIKVSTKATILFLFIRTILLNYINLFLWHSP